MSRRHATRLRRPLLRAALSRPVTDLEAAAPRVASRYRIFPEDVARTRALSGPVRTLADMSPEERAKVVESLERGRKP